MYKWMRLKRASTRKYIERNSSLAMIVSATRKSEQKWSNSTKYQSHLQSCLQQNHQTIVWLSQITIKPWKKRYNNSQTTNLKSLPTEANLENRLHSHKQDYTHPLDQIKNAHKQSIIIYTRSNPTYSYHSHSSPLLKRGE